MMEGVESFHSLGLHHLSELYDDLYFIAYIFYLHIVFGSDTQLFNDCIDYQVYGPIRKGGDT